MSKKNLKLQSVALAAGLFVIFALGVARVGVATTAAQGEQKKGIICLALPFINEEYDKMGDKTVVKFISPVLVKEFPSREIGVFADFSYPGHTAAPAQKMTLGFVHAILGDTLNPSFSGDHSLNVTVGGEQIPLGQTSYANKEQSTLRGKVQVETMSVEVQPSVFTRIANASTVAVRLGQTEFNLEDAQLKALRNMAQRARIN
jgi:hypothetical protein